MARRRSRLASEELKFRAAASVGFADKVRENGWDAATTQEIGQMVGEMVQMGKAALADASGERAGRSTRP